MFIYDSREPACKTPFGAVKTGETVSFTIHLSKLHACSDPVLVIRGIDAAEPVSVPMRLANATLAKNSYGCEFTADIPAVLVYHFEYSSHGKTVRILRDENGKTCISDHGRPWQLTVYDAAMQTPAFLREGVIYQIFPDRFYGSGQEKQNVPADRVLRGDWGGMPNWRPDADGEVRNNDYFGGDLSGIEQKLVYLQSLGVTAVYLNPVFEAHSNHRYDTADYTKIDPLLGTNEDFCRLAAKAKELGISLILDGVFSHTGSDSVYFNKNRRYGDGGAYNDWNSPYREWYRFEHYPEKYDCWWGFQTLPNIDENNPGYLDYICGENGVLKQWLDAGAAGFRLDVADELPDEFLDALRGRVKSQNPDAAVIGEVWEDASTKMSYGKRRRYLLGRQLDSVMNYPFTDAILSYVRAGDAGRFLGAIMQILENYPKPVIPALMNSLSTHDTERAITVLVAGPAGQNGREWQEQRHNLPLEALSRGKELFRLASILQFGLPGMPCVYYGDEAGLAGYRDPFNRCCYPWGSEDAALVSFIAQLGKMRRDYPIFADAEFVPLTFTRHMCCFERRAGSVRILFAVNRDDKQHRIRLPGLDAGTVLAACGTHWDSMLGPRSGLVLYFEKK